MRRMYVLAGTAAVLCLFAALANHYLLAAVISVRVNERATILKLEDNRTAVALALAPRVRVNAIAPGITLESGRQGQENFEGAHQLNPLGRGCSPGEIAGAVRLIAASPAMTGTIITIDGGLSLANPGRDVAFVPQVKP